MNSFVKILGANKIVRFNGVERKGDPINWEADISDLRNWGYTQQVQLEEGIQQYIEWLKK